MRKQKTSAGNIPREIIKQAIVRIKTKNPAFSNNALAKSVGISSGYISQFLNGKRELSIDTALAISRFLKLSEREEQLFIEGLTHNKKVRRTIETNVKERAQESLSLARDYKILFDNEAEYLAHWYNLALSDLVMCKGFKAHPEWIAKRLAISKIEAEQALSNLIKLKIIENKNGKWIKTNARLQMPTKSSRAIIREYHKQALGKAIHHMESKTSQSDFDVRSIRGRTIAVNPKKIQEARIYIQNFLDTLTQLLEDGNCEEVYQMNIQFFPLTEKE